MNTQIRKGSFGADAGATNPVVTRQAMEFFQSMDGFISTRDVPLIRVPAQSGKLAILLAEQINRDEVELRGQGPAEARKSTIKLDTVDYATDERAIEYLITASQAAKIGYEYGADVPSVVPRALALKAAIHTEGRFAALWNSSAWYRTVSGNATDGADGGTTQNLTFWSDTSKDPAKAIYSEKRKFLLRTGKMPTNLRLGAKVYEVLATHPLIRAQIALTIGGASQAALYTPMATAEQLSMLFGLKVSVSHAIKNTSHIDGTPSNSFVITDEDALMTYDVDGAFDAVSVNGGPPSVALTESCGFARVAWTGLAPDGFQVRQIDRGEVGAGGSRSWILDIYQGFVIVDPKFGTFFDGIVQ